MSTKKAKKKLLSSDGVAPISTKSVGWSFQDTDVPANVMEVRVDNKNRWVSLTLEDGMIFEGTIAEEASYGLYLRIGGNEDRLSLWPWHQISRVVYKIDT